MESESESVSDAHGRDDDEWRNNKTKDETPNDNRPALPTLVGQNTLVSRPKR